jgi:hypothetical protein
MRLGLEFQIAHNTLYSSVVSNLQLGCLHILDSKVEIILCATFGFKNVKLDRCALFSCVIVGGLTMCIQGLIAYIEAQN